MHDFSTGSTFIFGPSICTADDSGKLQSCLMEIPKALDSLENPGDALVKGPNMLEEGE
jgi:hypothetical protein